MSDYRDKQQQLNRQGRAARRGQLVATSPQIRNGGLELRRRRDGTVLIQVRDPVGTYVHTPRTDAPRES